MEKAMKEIEGSLTETFTTFMKEYLEKKKEEFEKELEKQQKEFYCDVNPQIIYLNVGGRRFATTAKTLQKIPDSYLDKLVRGEVPIIKDKDGNIFLDKNGTIFEYIIDYLRDGELVYPEDSKLKKRMKDELREMNLLGSAKLVKWTWDKKNSHCSNTGQIVLSNSDLTVTKTGNDGIGVIFGNTQLESDEYEWEITVNDKSTYFKCMGICDKKTNRPQNFSYYNAWCISTDSKIHKLLPTYGLKPLKNGSVVRFKYDGDLGEFSINAAGQTYKVSNIKADDYEIYPFVYLHRKENKLTLNVI